MRNKCIRIPSVFQHILATGNITTKRRQVTTWCTTRLNSYNKAGGDKLPLGVQHVLLVTIKRDELPLGGQHVLLVTIKRRQVTT